MSNFSPPANRRAGFSPTRARRNLSPSQPRTRREVNGTEPLLKSGSNQEKPPLAGTEVDELEPDDRETTTKPQPGVDDGFFSKPENPDAEPMPEKPNVPDLDESDVGRFPANHPRPRPPYQPEFPYAPGYGPEIVDMPDYAPTEFGGESIPDVNLYQHKKTLAQGMMDLALFSANANQLRYVLESYDRHPYYFPSVILISLSLLSQVAVGVGLIWNARYNVKDKKEICIANRINNFTIIGIFFVTVINVFVSAFGVANAPTTTAPTTIT